MGLFPVKGQPPNLLKDSGEGHRGAGIHRELTLTAQLAHGADR